jgi:hypothetical protein
MEYFSRLDFGHPEGVRILRRYGERYWWKGKRMAVFFIKKQIFFDGKKKNVQI